jgi:transmembrane sensor
VRLLWGEALFDVRHDVERPFRVISDGVLLEDVGTQFDVYTHRDGVSVSVIDGRVHLYCDCMTVSASTPGVSARRTQTPPSVSTSLGPSEAASITHTQSADIFENHPLSVSARQDSVAWKNGVIVLDNLTLGKAVDEFNRYSRQKLIIADPSIAGNLVGGRFEGPDIDSFLMELSSTYGIRSVRSGSASEPGDVELFGNTGKLEQ